jgi:peroxiredoxin
MAASYSSSSELGQVATTASAFQSLEGKISSMQREYEGKCRVFILFPNLNSNVCPPIPNRKENSSENTKKRGCCFGGESFSFPTWETTSKSEGRCA